MPDKPYYLAYETRYQKYSQRAVIVGDMEQTTKHSPDIVDGSFSFNDGNTLFSNCPSDYRNINGIRPVLWLETEDK